MKRNKKVTIENIGTLGYEQDCNLPYESRMHHSKCLVNPAVDPPSGQNLAIHSPIGWESAKISLLKEQKKLRRLWRRIPPNRIFRVLSHFYAVLRLIEDLFNLKISDYTLKSWFLRLGKKIWDLWTSEHKNMCVQNGLEMQL